MLAPSFKSDRLDEVRMSNFLLQMDQASCDEDLCNVHDLCRLCMAEESSATKMMQITDLYPADSNCLISQMIKECLSIDVADDESNTLTQVCEDCVVDLYTFADFKNRCTAVDSQLRQIVSRKRKLSKAQALYGEEITDSTCCDQQASNEALTVSYQLFNVNDENTDTSSDGNYSSPLNTIKISVKNERNLHLPYIDEYEKDSGGMCDTIGESQCKEHILPNPENAGNAEKTKSLSTGTDNESLTEMETLEEDDLSDEEDVEVHVSLDGTSVVQRVVTKVHSNGDQAHSQSRRQCVNKKFASSMPEVLVVVNKNKHKQFAFKCQECGKVFMDKILHRRHVASHRNQKGYICQYCDKWFPVKSSLARHERTHSGEKPHTCVLCERSFSQKEILQRHILTHSDSKPFLCPYCQKGYTQKEALNVHIKSSHEERSTVLQYPCPLCEKAFCHPSGLSRHMQVHIGKRHSCECCGRYFTDKSSLRRHQKRRHLNFELVEPGCRNSSTSHEPPLLHECL